MTIHVVGDLCVDSTFRLDRLPGPGETLNALAAGEGAGGKAANQAVAAARTGASVTLWAPVGNDPAAGWLEGLVAPEVSTLQLLRFDLPSDRSVIMVDRHGENAIVTAVACAEAFDPLTMGGLRDTWAAGDTLVMQGNLRPAATMACLIAAKDAGLFTILNPSPLPTEPLDLAAVSLVVVNRVEAAALSGETEVEKAARRLLALGAGSVIVTLGEAGALMLGAANLPAIHLPAGKADAVDTSGAGDCFTGTLAGLLAQGVSISEAARIAMQAAAIAVGRAGTLASFPTRAEFTALTKTLRLEKA
ncbi:MAG: PfkB family carbohydrate kinase [Rhizobium sp.]